MERELQRRLYTNPSVTDGLFKQQRLFLCDPARFKVAFNTRRSGKSYLAASALFHFAILNPGTQSVYIALTRDSARRILWPIVEKLNEEFKINAEPIESMLTCKLPNGSSFFLVGADQKNFISRLLGVPYKLAIIDEAQGFHSHIVDLIDEVLTPSMMDHDGEIWLMGTPGPIPSGYFHDITTGKTKGFSVHQWSLFQNPYLPKANEFLEALLLRKGWTKDNPTYRRQYLGEWVLDTDALLYKFNEHRNLISEVPHSNNVIRIMGLDFGYDDATAWVVLTWNQDSKTIYVEYAFKKAGLIPSEIAEITKKLTHEYSPVKTVADTGGLGKSIAEELRRRHSLQIHAADKKDKATFIQLMNDDLVSGRLKIKASLTNLIEELQKITKNEEGIEDPDCICDLADALLYAFKASMHWTHEAKRHISRDSDEYMDHLLEKEANSKQNETDWWESLDASENAW